MINTVKMKKQKMKRSDLIFYIICAFLPVLHFLIFYLGVNLNSILMAFQNYEIDGSHTFAGFSNIANVVKDLVTLPTLTISIRNSLVFAAFNFLVGTTLALLFSYYIFKGRVLSQVFRVLLFVPSIISTIVTVLVYRYTVTTLLPSAINSMFCTSIEGLLDNPSTKFPAIVFYNIFIGFGSGTLLYVGAMNNISESVMESAKLEGAGAVTEFVKIVLPLIWPTFITLLVTNITAIFTTQLELYSFYGTSAENGIYTIGYYMYLETLEGSKPKMPYLASMGVVITLFLVPVTLLIRYLMLRFGPSVE